MIHLQRMDSVSESMEAHCIVSLFDRRSQPDLKLINKIHLGNYEIDLKDYILFKETHNTRGNTINPHFISNIFKHVFFNRMSRFVTNNIRVLRMEVKPHTNV